MRSLEWALIQNDCGLVKRGNFHFRNDFTTIFVVISLVVPPGLSIYIFFMNINFRFIQLDFGEIWKYYSCIDLFPPPILWYYCSIYYIYNITYKCHKANNNNCYNYYFNNFMSSKEAKSRKESKYKFMNINVFRFSATSSGTE